MNYIVTIEGQNIPIPEDIGKDDSKVKKALAPYYPEVANALITRVEKDETTTITVVKRAGSKGAESLDYLIACQGGKNPAIECYELIQASGDVSPLKALEMGEQIETALMQGQEQQSAVRHAADRLIKSSAQCAPGLILGF
jgi:hypothetical protein